MEKSGDNPSVCSIIELQIQTEVEKLRPEEEIRGELDYGYSFTDNTLEVYSIRPRWNHKNEKFHSPIIKCRYVKSSHIWKIYWMRASGKWVSYEPHPIAKDVQEIFSVLNDDEYGCFFG